jgi:hypothetical protein
VYYSNGLQKGLVKKTNFIIVGSDFSGTLPNIPDSVVVHSTTNQSWLIVRTQIEGLKDLDNVHSVQDQYDLRPLSAYGKPFTQPLGVVNPNIPATPGPSPQANALDGEKFFTKAAEWFNKVSCLPMRLSARRFHSLMKTRPQVWTRFSPNLALFTGNHSITVLCLLRRKRQWVSRQRQYNTSLKKSMRTPLVSAD